MTDRKHPTTSIQLEDEQREALRRAAQEEDRSMGYIIRQAIREYLVARAGRGAS